MSRQLKRVVFFAVMFVLDCTAVYFAWRALHQEPSLFRAMIVILGFRGLLPPQLFGIKFDPK